MAACILAGVFPLAVGVLALSLLSLNEYHALVKPGKVYRFEGYALDVFAVLVTLFSRHDESMLLIGLLLFIFYILTHFMISSGTEHDSGWRPMALLLLGFMYITVPLCAAIYLRSTVHGAVWLFLAVTTAALCDTAAFFAGRRFGKHKLAPAISPGKTLEGGIGGVLLAALGAALIGRFAGVPFARGMLLGGILGVFAIGGDLFESWLKRKAGVKDSGNLLAGHGGLLDRLDSHLFVLPAFVIFKAILLR